MGSEEFRFGSALDFHSAVHVLQSIHIGEHGSKATLSIHAIDYISMNWAHSPVARQNKVLWQFMTQMASETMKSNFKAQNSEETRPEYYLVSPLAGKYGAQ